MSYTLRSIFIPLVIVFALASCAFAGTPIPTPASGPPATSAAAAPTMPPPTVTPAPDPRAIAVGISEATAATETVHFAVTLSGKAVYSDPSQRFTLVSMEGDLQRPDSLLATLKVRASGSLIAVRTVSLAGMQYVTNPINREWLCAAPGDLFDPIVLFDPEQGVEHLLRDRFEQVTLVGVEALDGRPHYHLKGMLPGEALRSISYNSLGAGAVVADVWADQETLRASQLVLVDSATDGEKPSTWEIVFSNYNVPVDVRAPVQC